MITAEQIPDEVVNELFLRGSWRGSASEARAALAAVLNAWPGMFEEYMNNEDGDGASLCVILPLEASDE